MYWKWDESTWNACFWYDVHFIRPISDQLNVPHLLHAVAQLTVTEHSFKPRIRANTIKVLVNPCFFAHSAIETRIWMTRRFRRSCCVVREKYGGQRKKLWNNHGESLRPALSCTEFKLRFTLIGYSKQCLKATFIQRSPLVICATPDLRGRSTLRWNKWSLQKWNTKMASSANSLSLGKLLLLARGRHASHLRVLTYRK